MRRVVLCLLALTVLLPSIAFARGQYLCTIDQRVRETCCCPAKHAVHEPTGPTMRAECCKLTPRALSVTPAADQLRPPSPPSAPIVFTIVEPAPTVALRFVANVVAYRAHAPPDRPHLFAQHCAFLL